MGTAEPDVDENKLLRTVGCLTRRGWEDASARRFRPQRKNGFDLRKDGAA